MYRIETVLSLILLVSVVTRGFELVTRGFELITHGFELLTHELELADLNS